VNTHKPRQDRVGALWRELFPDMPEPHNGALSRRVDALGEERVIEAIRITRSRMRPDAPTVEMHMYLFGVLRRMGRASLVGKWFHSPEHRGRVLSSPRADTYFVEYLADDGTSSQSLVTLDHMIGWTFCDSREGMSRAEKGQARWGAATAGASA